MDSSQVDLTEAAETCWLNAFTVQSWAQDAGHSASFDQSGASWLGHYIYNNRASWSRDEHRAKTDMLGSFLGQCLVETFGGSWSQSTGGQLAVQFTTGDEVLPYVVTANQIAAEPKASVLRSFQAMIAAHRDMCSDPEDEPARHWRGGSLLVDGSIVQNFIPRSGTADEIIDGALGIVRDGEADQVHILADMAEVDLEDLTICFEKRWLSRVNSGDERTVCRFNKSPLVKLDAIAAGEFGTLYDRAAVLLGQHI